MTEIDLQNLSINIINLTISIQNLNVGINQLITIMNIEQNKEPIKDPFLESPEENMRLTCPNCKSILKRIDVGTLDNPGRFQMVCINCGYPQIGKK